MRNLLFLTTFAALTCQPTTNSADVPWKGDAQDASYEELVACPAHALRNFPRITLAGYPQAVYEVSVQATVVSVIGSAFHLNPAEGNEILVTAQLPDGLGLPLAAGQVVSLYARQEPTMFIAHDQVFIVWDQSGNPVVFFYGATVSHGNSSPWYDCAGHHPCPSVRLLDTACPGTTDVCGTRVHPKSQLRFCEEPCSQEPPSLYEGQTVVAPDGFRYTLIEAWMYTPQPECADSPGAWLSGLVVRQ